MTWCNLSGLRALVTGASGGIGTAICRELAAAGAELVMTGTSKEKLTNLTAEIPGSTVAADLATPEGRAKIIEAAGPVDILVNNAGLARDEVFIRQKAEDAAAVLNVNLQAAMELTRAVMPAMMKKRFGRVVSISSVVAAMGNPGQTAYCASKAGLEGFSRALSREVGRRGVTVNCVAPGFVNTAMTGALPQKKQEEFLAKVPLARFGEPAEIAAVVRFLASREAGYVSGAVLHVNGGMY